MKKLNNIYKVIGVGAALVTLSCNNDLDQLPPNIPESNSITEFSEVLNAAYFYQHASATPMAIMGDFRADNALMEEEPFPAFDTFDEDLAGGDLVGQFFLPFYTDLYSSIFNVNNVIDNSVDPVEVGEAKFLRALSYFKLVMVFGDVSVNLSPDPDFNDTASLARRPAAEVYNEIIIPDLEDAVEALNGSGITYGRASSLAAQALLGKVYMFLGDFVNAEMYLNSAITAAGASGVSLEGDFADVVGANDDDESSEIIYSIPVTTGVPDNYSNTEFGRWFAGGDTKSNLPIDSDLVAAFDAVADQIIPVEDPENPGQFLDPVDIRKVLTVEDKIEENDDGEITQEGFISVKYPTLDEQDWVELRLSDIIMLYAEALNENGSSPTEVLALLDPIRSRAGLFPLDPAVINTQDLVAQAILDERRLELAFEGHRWFDLVRTGTVDAEMGETIDPVYHIFPLPDSEIRASFVDGEPVITQNEGY